jgi:DNA (cytosine-5)-methyltransferase 1
MFIQGKKVKARLLSKQEAARLMGLPDSYILPERYNDAYLLAGDGVAVPVVRFLAETIFEPILKLNSARKAA